MNTNQRMVNRIKSIYLYLKNKGSAVDCKELSDEFGYHARTIQRDLKTLEYNNLIKSTGRGKWAIST